jgi:hypothetical protein
MNVEKTASEYYWGNQPKENVKRQGICGEGNTETSYKYTKVREREYNIFFSDLDINGDKIKCNLQ